jgi:hypothetical protein
MLAEFLRSVHRKLPVSGNTSYGQLVNRGNVSLIQVPTVSLFALGMNFHEFREILTVKLQALKVVKSPTPILCRLLLIEDLNEVARL